MSPSVRVLRFARICTEVATLNHGEPISCIYLDEQPAPVGQIIRAGAQWGYHLAGHVEPIVSSTLSRQDLERQIVLWHLGELTGATDHDSAMIQPVFAAAI
jgi:hypothetical protein